MSSKSRRIGHDAERYYANVFKKLGYKYCVTSRYGSRIFDDAKIDLIFIPFNIQIKAGVQKSLNPGKELKLMREKINEFFPKDEKVHDKPCLVIHKKPIGRGKKETEFHQMVYMTFLQFSKFKKRFKNFTFLKEKIYKREKDEEFKHIVSMTFSYFKNKIIKNYDNKI